MITTLDVVIYEEADNRTGLFNQIEDGLQFMQGYLTGTEQFIRLMWAWLILLEGWVLVGYVSQTFPGPELFRVAVATACVFCWAIPATETSLRHNELEVKQIKGVGMHDLGLMAAYQRGISLIVLTALLGFVVTTITWIA